MVTQQLWQQDLTALDMDVDLLTLQGTMASKLQDAISLLLFAIASLLV